MTFWRRSRSSFATLSLPAGCGGTVIQGTGSADASTPDVPVDVSRADAPGDIPIDSPTDTPIDLPVDAPTDTRTDVCMCTSDTCTADSPCTTMGGPCACRGEPFRGEIGNTCVPGNCKTDSDCGVGGYCSPSTGNSTCGGLVGYYCHTPRDTCIDDVDCTSTGGPMVCTDQTAVGHWACTEAYLCA